MFGLFKKRPKRLNEDVQTVVYRMFKEKRDIEDIMNEFNLDKEEIIQMIQDEKRIRRGE